MDAANPGDPRERRDILNSPLQFLGGVGPRMAERLARLGLRTVADMLYYFPRGHLDRSRITPLMQLVAGETMSACARVMDAGSRRLRDGRIRIEALLDDGTASVGAVWWNPYVADRIRVGWWMVLSGKVVLYEGRLQFQSPDFEMLPGEPPRGGPPHGEASLNFWRLTPVYRRRSASECGRGARDEDGEPDELPLRAGRVRRRNAAGEEAPPSQSFLRKVAWKAVQAGALLIPDALPPELLNSRGLMPIGEAIRSVHFPANARALGQARRRLAYEELFMLSLGVAIRRHRTRSGAEARPLVLTKAIDARIRARLPFALTRAQNRCVEEIARDMAGRIPMNRLLQGDVGSGKTAVAIYALLLCVACGAQAAVLAPTEVLAEQHYRTLSRMLADSRVRLAMLTGSLTEDERGSVLGRLRRGEIDIVVGTHALLSPDVEFNDLAMVVMDEQHKFGVMQRAVLRAKGRQPHCLVMTATPIPRTLALAYYGDLDLSAIDEMPPGRGEVETVLLEEKDRPKAYAKIREEAASGRQSYIVLPRVEEEELPAGGAGAEVTLWPEIRAAASEAERLSREVFPDLRIGLLHGRMPSEEKEKVVSEMLGGKIQVLVSTIVVEVGIDLPSATVMMVENAERFGLSTLHQLRGRVGRSGLRSWCFLMGRAATEDARRRLKIMCETRDGFRIAEEDFRLRGPGEFFGTSQHGMPELKIADIFRDEALLMQARRDAQRVIEDDPDLSKPANAALRSRVLKVLSGRLGLIDVG